MSEQTHYLVRDVKTGKMRTVTARSNRGAMNIFVANYGPPLDRDFGVKMRLGDEAWEYYRVSRGGVRKLPG